jgi:S1-C subfamily serine protease
MGAGGTQTQKQPQETTILSINGTPVKNTAELQAALDAIAPGASVKIVYKSGGKDRVIEAVVK